MIVSLAFIKSRYSLILSAPITPATIRYHGQYIHKSFRETYSDNLNIVVVGPRDHKRSASGI